MFEANWYSFLHVFNGPLWDYSHYCTGPDCCRGPDGTPYHLPTTKARMKRAVVKVIYRDLPRLPEKAKWGKTFPCVVWFILAMACRMLQYSYDIAFDPKDFAVKVKMADVGNFDYFEQVNWRGTQGIRAANGRELIQDPNSLIMLVLLAVIMESLHYLHMWLLLMSSVLRRRKMAPPSHAPLMDFCDPARSVVSQVSEWYSRLLPGQSSRLRLIWMPTHDSWEAWCGDERNLPMLTTSDDAFCFAAVGYIDGYG